MATNRRAGEGVVRRQLALKGARLGGRARAEAMTREERAAAARRAAQARWGGDERIAITFHDARTPPWRLADGARPLVLPTRVEHTKHDSWEGEVWLASLHPGVPYEPLEISPAAADWMDVESLYVLAQQWAERWERRDWNAATYRVRERPDGRTWYQEIADVPSTGE